MLNLIKASLWNESINEAIDYTIYEEMKAHAIAALPGSILSKLNLTAELYSKWQLHIIHQVSYYCRYKYEQSNLPIKVPFVILKGMAAAKYYTHPEYRAMGDIDIITEHEDFLKACNELLDNGFLEITSEKEAALGRHRSFTNREVVIEVHAFFAMLSDKDKARRLDSIIIDNINDSHYLPDMENGLVILEHIHQHLAGGLGLRQIIDWMMFVNSCLPDEKWVEFQMLVQSVGLETLAIVTTQMCVIYLGLPKREWCKSADANLCKQLMDYILSCGNFGLKRNDEGSISENVFFYARTLKSACRLLQKRGLENWKATKKYALLRPYAWIYQIGRYILRGIMRKDGNLKREYLAARMRNRMFDALGVTIYADEDSMIKNDHVFIDRL